MLLVTIVQDDPGLCVAVHGGGLLQHDRHHHQPFPARLHRGVQVQLGYDVLCMMQYMYWIGVVNPIMTN